MKKQYRLTKQGVDELKAELKQLIAQRSLIAERLKTARKYGDLTENAEYAAARQEQERNEQRISEVEYILLNVELIKTPRTNGKVRLGSKVQLKGSRGNIKAFQVVGTVEADPLNGKISDESPIGKALIGKTDGDKVEISTPSETITYTIVEIS
ncbi:MAG: transcription elongation factor GreA [Candidatus Saccharimonadales bacterium]